MTSNFLFVSSYIPAEYKKEYQPKASTSSATIFFNSSREQSADNLPRQWIYPYIPMSVSLLHGLSQHIK